jgi:hypothetical protein
MLCILQQTSYIRKGIEHDFFNKFVGDLCRVSLGNLPKAMPTAQIEICFRHAWHVKAQQSNDLYCEATRDYPCDSNRWFGYTLKEAQQDTRKAWATNGTWDVENCWIPHTALAAD